VPVKTIGLLYHPRLPGSRELAAQAARRIESLGANSWTASAWDEEEINRRLKELALLITLGGDGTVLRVAPLAASHGVPILGVNMGRVGFLSELEPERLLETLHPLVEGKFWVEERIMLQAGIQREGETSGPYEALNDVVVGRESLARTVRLATHINGEYLTTYVADGLIVSTPTGSTAYALAAGGPILSPQLKNIVLIPIAPHLSLNRPLVLTGKEKVGIQVFTDHRAVLTVDGQRKAELSNGDEVTIQVGPNLARFARLQDQGYFYRTLAPRLINAYQKAHQRPD